MKVSGETLLGLVGWAFVLIKLRSIHWDSARKEGGLTVTIWLMMFFFTITLTLLGDFGEFLDAHTFSNLSQLIAYPSILMTIYLATRESLNAIDRHSYRRTIHLLGLFLLLTCIVLFVIYALSLWRAPKFNSVPQSLPEAVFRFTTFCFGAFMCLVEVKAYLAYLPMEKSSILRLRALVVILCAISTFSFFLVRALQIAGYFWSPLASPILNSLSVVLLVLSSLLYFAVFLRNGFYMWFLMVISSIHRWQGLQDLKYLRSRLVRLCPEVVSPAGDPPFWMFLFNSEYYLYSTIIAIMDSKTMLDDLISEGALHGEPALWDGDMVQEVVQVKTALQSVNSSGNFWEIVDEYRQASRVLTQISSNSLRTIEQ